MVGFKPKDNELPYFFKNIFGAFNNPISKEWYSERNKGDKSQ